MHILYLSYIEKQDDLGFSIFHDFVKILKLISTDFSYLSNKKNTFILDEIDTKKVDVLFIQHQYSFQYFHKILIKMKSVPILFISYDGHIRSNPQLNIYDAKIIINTKYFLVHNYIESNSIKINFPILFENINIQKKLSPQLILFSTGIFRIDMIIVNICIKNNIQLLLFVNRNESTLYKNSIKSDCISVKLKSDYKHNNSTNEIILASGNIIIQSMYYMKKCIVISDKGYGGVVSVNNYDLLKLNGFSGRNLGSVYEYPPIDLLEFDIFHLLKFNDYKELRKLREKVRLDFSIQPNISKITTLVSHCIRIKKAIINQDLHLLKPYLSKGISIHKQSIINNNEDFSIDNLSELFVSFIRNCNGEKTIQELLEKFPFSDTEQQKLYYNLVFLYKNKIIEFGI